MSSVALKLMTPLAAATATLVVGYLLVATDPGRQALPTAAEYAQAGEAKTQPASQPASHTLRGQFDRAAMLHGIHHNDAEDQPVAPLSVSAATYS